MIDNGFLNEYDNAWLYNYNSQNESFFPLEEQNDNESFSKEDVKEYDNYLINENYVKNENIPQYDSFYPKISMEPPNIITVPTEPFSNPFINQKRKRESQNDIKIEKEEVKEEKEKEEINNEKGNKEEINEDNNNIKINVKEKTLGRRKKDEIYSGEADHDKFKEDNVMRKLKSFLNKYLIDRLNRSLKDKYYYFYPLDTILNKYLKKDFNEALLNKKIFEIFQEYETNNRYQNKQSNKILIQKIFEEKKETETIKILMMTYRDILDYVRDNDLDYFLNQIKEKELKNRKNKNENINKYMNLVKELLNDYENWFLRKNGRNSDKK